MSNEEIIKFLDKFDEVLHISGFLSGPVRAIGWWLIYQSSKLLDLISGGEKAMLKLINFYKSPLFTEFLKKYDVLITGFATLAIMFLALGIARPSNADRKEKNGKYIENILIAACLTVGLPSIISLMVGVFTPAANENLATSASSVEIFKSNITDLYALDREGWEEVEVLNDIDTLEDLKYLDITEPVDTGGWFFDESPLSSQGKDGLSKKITTINKEKKLAKLENHMVGSDEAYFRYSWHPFLMFFELAMRVAIGLFVLYTLGYKGLELAVVMGLLKVSAWTDIENGKRNKDLFFKVRNILIVLYLTIILQSVYSLYCSYLKTVGLNSVVTVVAMFSGAFFIIGGVAAIEQVFGVDSGVSGNFGSTLMGLGQASRMVGGIKSGIGNLGKKAAGAIGAVGKGASYTGSAGAGILKGYQESKGSGKMAGSERKEGEKDLSKFSTPNGSGGSNEQGAQGKWSNDSGGQSSGHSSSGTPSSGSGPTPLASAKKETESNGKKESGADKNGSTTPLSTPEHSSGSEPTQSKESETPSQTPLGNSPQESHGSSQTGQSETGSTSPLPYTPSKGDTLGTVIKGNVGNKKEQVKQSGFVQRNKRVYEVSKNTTRSVLQNRERKDKK